MLKNVSEMKYDVVSVIIPCYNQAEYLEETVESVLKQTYPNIEVIIVNDGSPDNTEEVASSLKNKYPDRIQLLTQSNQGVSQARNNGISLANGAYILPLDADDQLYPDMIHCCLQALKTHYGDIVYTDLRYTGIINRLAFKKIFSQNNILYENLPTLMSLFKKSVWEKIGGYKKNMHDGYEDWEFWVNAYKYGFKFQYYPKVLVKYLVKKKSRDTEALKRDAYLKAKIVMNHPELYTRHRVEQSIQVIKKAESLPDLYLYCEDKTLFDEKTIKHFEVFLQEQDTLKEKQFISSNLKYAFCSLDILEYYPSIEQLYREFKTNFILFYAPMHYEVENLFECSIAWDHSKGFVQTHGTVFPYVAKSIRENAESQLIAYRRLEKYHEKLDNDIKIRTERHNAYVNNLQKQISVLQENQYTLLSTSIQIPKEGINIISFYDDISKYINQGYYAEIKGKIVVSSKDEGKNIIIFEVIKKDLTKIPQGLRISGNGKFVFSYLKINNKTNEFHIRFDLHNLDDVTSMKIRPWNNPEQLYIQNEITLRIYDQKDNQPVFEKNFGLK